jgi:hypothetical protein
MSIKENLTITIEGDTLDNIRKIAQNEYRSINKQVLLLIYKGLKVVEEETRQLDQLLTLKEKGKL